MKQTYIWVAFVLLLVLNIVTMLRLGQANSRIDALKKSPNTSAPAATTAHEPEDIEVAISMNHIQRHANKLYFAGQNENWPLAGFYVHELEEAMEEIADGQVEDEGINISQLMQAMGRPTLEGLEKSIEAKNKAEFNTAYNLLVTNCNACHQSTNHPYIIIQNPKTPALDNQVY